MNACSGDTVPPDERYIRIREAGFYQEVSFTEETHVNDKNRVEISRHYNQSTHSTTHLLFSRVE